MQDSETINVQNKVMKKLNSLSEKYLIELNDYIDFLISKTHKENAYLKQLQQSEKEIENKKIVVIENNKDLNKHFESLEI